MDWNQIGVVVSHLDIAGQLPLEIYPSHFLRRADDIEIECIDRYIKRATSNSRPTWVKYGGTVRKVTTETGTTYTTDELPKELQKYWVIDCPADDHRLQVIGEIGRLIQPELAVGFQMMRTGSGVSKKVYVNILMPLHVVEKYSSHSLTVKNAEHVGTETLAEIGKLAAIFESLPEEAEFCAVAIKNFSELQRLPERSEFKIAGLFAILEMMLTHKPGKPETLDSIIHQLCGKNVLVKRFFECEVAFGAYFESASDEKTWKKLYAYRSSIVHGGTASFEGDLQILRSKKSVLCFLEDHIRELLKLGLRDPGFLIDLKRC